ncbi:hypothetical protein VTL71DRAFT_2748 [Oculimacula yallundae]|uniref:BTB domain-containing protein n=1 Tax=Oculimacula yallundae TaxID=86028 RepID=A0ABR4CBN3_9HELO
MNRFVSNRIKSTPRSPSPPGFKFNAARAPRQYMLAPRFPTRETTAVPALESSTSSNDSETKSVEETPTRSARNTEDATDAKLLVHQLIKSGKMVKVYTGKEKHCWELHEDAICHHSPYFQKAFLSGFKESTEKSIELDEETSEVFGRVVDWIYTGVLRCNKCTHEPQNHQEEDFMQYIKLWVFADKYMISGLSDSAVEVWSRCHRKADQTQPLVEEIDYIYENCPEKSPLRDRVVDKALKHFLTKQNQDHKCTARLLSCNSFFAEEFTKQLKEHLGLEEWHCRIRNCSPHKNGTILRSDRAAKRQRVDNSGQSDADELTMAPYML